jgi:hypothetical protein
MTYQCCRNKITSHVDDTGAIKTAIQLVKHFKMQGKK